MNSENALNPQHAHNTNTVEDTRNGNTKNMASGNGNLQALFTAVEMHIARREQGSTRNESPDILADNAESIEEEDNMDVDRSRESHPTDERHHEIVNTYKEEEITWKAPDVPCEKCDKKFGSLASMMRHTKLMHPESNSSKQAICEECGDIFTKESNMRNHMYTAHTGIPIRFCNICHATFVSKKSFSVHMARRHPDAQRSEERKKVPAKKSHFCTRCEYTSFTKSNIKRHYNAVHNRNSRPEFPCSHGCGQVLHTKTSWVAHELSCKKRPGNRTDNA